MPLQIFAQIGKFRILAWLLRPLQAFGAAFVFALVLAPDDLGAQKTAKSDRELAEEIRAYLKKRESESVLDGPSPAGSPTSTSEIWEDPQLEGALSSLPRIDLTPLAAPSFYSLEMEGKQRALQSLDDVINQESLRELRLR